MSTPCWLKHQSPQVCRCLRITFNKTTEGFDCTVHTIKVHVHVLVHSEIYNVHVHVVPHAKSTCVNYQIIASIVHNEKNVKLVGSLMFSKILSSKQLISCTKKLQISAHTCTATQYMYCTCIYYSWENYMYSKQNYVSEVHETGSPEAKTTRAYESSLLIYYDLL